MTVTRTTRHKGQYIIEILTGSGSYNLTLPEWVREVEYLLVGGGGSGGNYAAGGGGAGGFLTGQIKISSPTLTIVVGAGGIRTESFGAPGVNGENTTAFGLTAKGGGGGGSHPTCTASSGGSGGGGGWKNGTKGTANGTPSTQGHDGGNCGGGDGDWGAAGGGGAGAVGGNGSTTTGGIGGAGLLSTITGIALYYAAGGGAAGAGTAANGGSGIGGNGAVGTGNGTAGAANTGSGGGGGGGAGGTPPTRGGNGADGIVIIRYSLYPEISPAELCLLFDLFGEPTGEVYVWDPVNVDHTRTPGVDAFLYEQSFPTANINHSRSAAVGITEIEMGPVNVYHSRYPVFSWDRVITNPVDDTGTLISVTVSRGMDDAMTQAVFEYDGTTVGDIFGNDYMTKIQVQIPDYNGVSRVVFVGIAPSSKAHYEPAKDKMTLTAVDYGLYLTKNQLEDKDLALLPPANQTAEGSNIAKVLSFNYGLIAFQLGHRVVGGVSGATGTVIEVYAGGFMRMTLYPARGKFIDDEPLLVGGVQYATADGRSTDIPYTPYYLPTYPEDWIKSVLGGANWMRVTGIEPYRIVASGAYWDTELCPAVPFMFGSKESINDAMDRLAKYMKYIKLIKPRDIGYGNYRPAFYWVPLSQIDDAYNGLDLPAAAPITGPNDPFLAAPFELEQNGDNQVDRIKLMCQDPYGNWLVSAKGTNYANAGEGPIRTFYDEPQDICTQTDLDALCSDLYDLLTPRGMVWHATLIERSDLEIYQLLTISGYGSKIPDGTYRIINISCERGCAKNLTHVTFMLATAFSTLRKYGMTYMDSISEIQRIIKHWNDQKPQTELATCTATDGFTVTYETEAASKGRGRDGTAIGETAGTIIVGAKIIVHNTRGGIICLPVVGEAATGTTLSTVGEPAIISALRDESDHNYWYLLWRCGDNNINVSVNVHCATYPSAPGVVTGPGTTTGLYSTTNTFQLRIRFSGPSATYYVKLWGERNGAYSATGVTTTIESGADVTVGPAEEPESIGVIDMFFAAGLPDHEGNESSGVPCDYEIYDGVLPLFYNGTDNIDIGGPADSADDHFWGAQPGPGYFWTDDTMTIYGPKGSLPVGSAGWHAPINIKNLLNVGLNSIRVVVTDTIFGYYGCSELYIRSYYGGV